MIDQNKIIGNKKNKAIFKKKKKTIFQVLSNLVEIFKVVRKCITKEGENYEVETNTSSLVGFLFLTYLKSGGGGGVSVQPSNSISLTMQSPCNSISLTRWWMRMVSEDGEEMVSEDGE